jgi:hypothetical protein
LGVVSVFHLSIFAPCFSFHAKSAKKREEKIIVIPNLFRDPSIGDPDLRQDDSNR